MVTFKYFFEICFICQIFLAAVNKAAMDIIKFNFEGSVFAKYRKSTWWDPSQSWKRKWKNNDPNQGEWFWGSSTIFVSFTDAWHCFQHFFLLNIFVGFVFYTQCFPIINWRFWYLSDFVLFFALFTFIFEIFFSKIFKK